MFQASSPKLWGWTAHEMDTLQMISAVAQKGPRLNPAQLEIAAAVRRKTGNHFTGRSRIRFYAVREG